MHWIEMATVFLVISLVGAEFSVSAFVNPSAWRLEPEPQFTILKRLAAVLGRVMPFWYVVCLLLLGVESWLHWHTPAFGVLLTASVLWLLATLGSLAFLVPLNNRVIAGDADWQQVHRTWDRRHRVRVLILFLAAVLLLSAVVQ